VTVQTAAAGQARGRRRVAERPSARPERPGAGPAGLRQPDRGAGRSRRTGEIPCCARRHSSHRGDRPRSPRQPGGQAALPAGDSAQAAAASMTPSASRGRRARLSPRSGRNGRCVASCTPLAGPAGPGLIRHPHACRYFRLADIQRSQPPAQPPLWRPPPPASSPRRTALQPDAAALRPFSLCGSSHPGAVTRQRAAALRKSIAALIYGALGDERCVSCPVARL
jgi:hypothetical protein